MTRLALGSSLLVSVSLVGCGGVDATDSSDTTRPAILKATPGAGETGVPADAAIVITFSEPMDPASVEAAYSSHHLAPADVTMAWNATNDTLTILPNQPLALAEGTGNDPSATEATEYAIFVDTKATDAAGNALPDTFQLAFKTQKRMATTAAYLPELTRFRTSSGAVSAVGADLLVGDAGALSARGFVSFDLVTMPAGVEIEKATIGVQQTGVNGTPFDMGALDTLHLTYAAVDAAAWSAPALDTMGAISTTAALGPRSVDVSAAVASDMADRAARSNRSQYRLEFPAATNGDGNADNVVLGVTTFKMSITYLAP